MMRLPNALLYAWMLTMTGLLRSGAQLPDSGAQRTREIEKVTGIGGVFFRGSDP
jgi:hypothetical protein